MTVHRQPVEDVQRLVVSHVEDRHDVIRREPARHRTTRSLQRVKLAQPFHAESLPMRLRRGRAVQRERRLNRLRGAVKRSEYLGEGFPQQRVLSLQIASTERVA